MQEAAPDSLPGSKERATPCRKFDTVSAVLSMVLAFSCDLPASLFSPCSGPDMSSAQEQKRLLMPQHHLACPFIV